MCCVTRKTMNDVSLARRSDTDLETATTCGSCLSEPPAAAALGLFLVRFIIAITNSTTWPNWRACARQAVVYDCASLSPGNSLYLVPFERGETSGKSYVLPQFYFSNLKRKTQYKTSAPPPKKRKKTTGMHISAMPFPSYFRRSEAAAATATTGMTGLVGIPVHQAGRFEC